MQSAISFTCTVMIPTSARILASILIRNGHSEVRSNA